MVIDDGPGKAREAPSSGEQPDRSVALFLPTCLSLRRGENISTDEWLFMFWLIIGGKGTVRRKVVKKTKTSTAHDDKKLQGALKKLNVQPIPGVEEVNMFREDGNVLHFTAPKGELRFLPLRIGRSSRLPIGFCLRIAPADPFQSSVSFHTSIFSWFMTSYPCTHPPAL